MMKRYLIAFFLMFFVGSASAATTFLSTEKNLWFTPDVVVNAVVEHFNDESKHMPMLDLYQELMDEQTGKVSVDILFKVCNKGGLNTRRAEGYAQCKAFIEQMLKDAEMAAELNLGGYCPGLDANGKNPNNLSSITDETRVGDFCSSTNIASGEVVFKAGYACTCLAYQCNTGYRFRTRGDCVTPQQEPTDRNVNASNYCPRTQTTGASNNNSTEKCKSYCTQIYKDKDCYWDALIWDKDKNVCICNPTDQEISDKRARDEEKRKNQKFFDVCNRSSKGKSGGQEICVNNVFNWVNVTRMQAVELAKMWAKKHNQDEIHCDDGNIKTVAKVWGEQSVDDYLMCASLDSNIFYTFQFDDVKESIDSDIQAGLVHGICVLYGYSSNIVKNDTLTNAIGRRGCYATCTNELKSAGANFELTLKQDGNLCTFEQRSFSKEDADKYLAKFGNLDNYHFMSDQIQTQGSQSGTNNNIYGYIASQGYVIRNLECVPNPAELKGKWYQDDDDILRCYLSVGGDPKRHTIDFVFDDISESWSYKYEAGEAAMGCLGSGGKYEGKECYGLSATACADAERQMKRINPGSKGTEWDAKNQVCIMLDQEQAAIYDGLIQVGTGAIAAVDCVFGTKIGCVMFAVETVGLAADITSKELITDRVQEFLRVSTICKARDCAKRTIQQLGAKVISVQDALDEHSIKNVDEELARLILLLEPEDLQSELSDGDWNSMVAAVGGETDDWTGAALVWMGRIGVMAQFASLGTSGVNLLRKAPQALKTLLRSADNIAAAADDVADMTKALVVYDATKAADAAADAAKGAKAADAAADAAKAADKASDAGKAAGGATSGAKAAGNADDAARGATSGAKAADATADAGRATGATADKLHDGLSLNKKQFGLKYHPDTVDAYRNPKLTALATEILQEGLKGVDKMTDAEKLALSKKMFEFDELLAAASKTADKAADAGKAADKAADAGKVAGGATSGAKAADAADAAADAGKSADNAADAGRAANNAADASKGGKAADNTSKATRAANLYEDWKGAGKGRESYEFDFAVLGNNEKELTEFIGYVQKDGYYIQKVGNRIFVKDALSDLYKRAATGDKNVFVRKDVLSPQRWEELNQQVSKLGLKFVDDNESAGFMKLIRETPAKTGDELWESLKSRNWKGVRKNGFYYMFIDGASGGQHATGLKFHISVSPDDLDKATDVIGVAMKRSGIGGEFKVFLDPDDMTWMTQTGKEFTVYVSQDGYNSSKIQQFIRECEQGLRNSGVKTNGIGSNVSVGDRAVSGSQYIRYRYDQLDDLGRPQGFYRSKYDFVAPNSQYGGDIMNGISAN